MSNVNIVKSDAEFDQVKMSAGNKLLAIAFSAKWCGPCNQIAPKFNQLSVQFGDIVFVKVDVDICKTTAALYNISSMPTFVFEKDGKVLDTLKGANPAALTTKIESIYNTMGTSTTIMGGEMVELGQFMVQKSCLNEDEEHPISAVFEDNESFLESDCDPELLMTFTFSQMIKLHSIKVKAPDDGSAPKAMKLYINQPSLMDFDGARDGNALQEIEFSKEDIVEGTIIPLKYVKLQAVNSITLFFGTNQGNEDTTKIQNIVLYGKPASHTTNMRDFQRVSGKAGEAH